MIVLQNLIFPKPGVCTDEALYFRRNEYADYAWSKDEIVFRKYGTAEFDTYFNSVSAGKLFKYTIAKKVYLKLRLSGSFRITLIHKEKIGGQIFVDFISEVAIHTEKDDQEVLLPYETKSDKGMLCFKLFCLKDGGKFFGGEYLIDVDDDKIRDIKLGIDICTFKREKFVERNMQNLSKRFFSSPESPMYGKLEVFISDNAHTLPQTVANEFIHVFKNKNVGGAGGFTRGLIEMIRDGNPGGITHALIMDDDIVFDPETIYRTYVLLSILKEKYEDAFIGGAMLRLDRQNIQVESGAIWNCGAVISNKSGLDLNNVDACLYNEYEETADYNAWWYSVVPIKCVSPDNLPLPIFIRGDDAEYGLRNTKQLILMNGICVWHEPFENKYSSTMFYYIFRNRLIDNSVRGIDFTTKRLLQEFKDHVYNELFTLRYKNAELLLQGVEDFFRGIDWLKQQDGEKLHKQIMSAGYKMSYIEDLDFAFSYPMYEQMSLIPEDKGFKGFLKKALIKLTFHGLFLPARKVKIVQTVGAVPRQFIMTKRALNYDISSQKAFVTEKNTKEALAIYRRYMSVRALIKRKYKCMREEYRKHGHELMNIAFWQKYLGI